jgi:hypothetical protein
MSIFMFAVNSFNCVSLPSARGPFSSSGFLAIRVSQISIFDYGGIHCPVADQATRVPLAGCRTGPSVAKAVATALTSKDKSL